MQEALVGGVVATEVLQELVSYVHDLSHTVVILHGKYNHYTAKLKVFAGQIHVLYQTQLPSYLIQICQGITHRYN